MRANFRMLYFAIISLIIISVPSLQVSSAGPSDISATVQLESDWTIALADEGETPLAAEGAFVLNEKSGWDLIGEVTATLSVSEGQWEAHPRQAVYADVTVDAWQTFMIDVTIPEEASPGQSSAYTVKILLEGQVSSDEVTAGFIVTVIAANANGDEPADDDDGSDVPDVSDGGSFPLWPVFLLGLIAVAAFVGFWAYKNIEIVREVDGRRKIYLREKDTGRIFGKEK